MTVKSILRIGEPTLRQVSLPVDEFDTDKLHGLIADMRDTMAAHDGAGLAAIQIGIPLRVVIFGVESNPRYPEAEAVPMTVLVNPDITPLVDDVTEDWEGCLSVPGMRGAVPRYTRIQYRGFDQFGEPVERVAQGFHARVVQHECDHLDGVLYVQRIRDLQKFGFIEELAASGVIGSLTE